MADAPSGNGANNSGSGSGNPSDSNVDIERMVNDAVSKAIGSRMKRLNLEEQIQAAVQKAVASVAVSAPAQAEPAEVQNHGDAEQRLNLKTIDQNYKALKEELARERQARQDAEKQALDTRLHKDLHEAFSRKFGAENPHLGVYVKQYAHQFQVHENNVYRKGKDEFGNDELVPLHDATEDLSKNELKHLIPQKTTNLPPTSLIRGMPMGNQQPQGQSRGGFLEQEIMHAQAMSDPAAYAEMYGTKKQ